MQDVTPPFATLIVYYAVHPIVYTAAALVTPASDDCSCMVDPAIVDRGVLCLLATMFVVAHGLPSIFPGRVTLLYLSVGAIALLYTCVITTVCAPWLVQPNVGSFSFVPKVVEIQYRIAFIFTLYGAFTLLFSIEYEEKQGFRLSLRDALSVHYQWLSATMFVGSLGLLIYAPKIDTSMIQDMPSCFSGRFSVFDGDYIRHTPHIGRPFDLILGLTAVFSLIATIGRSRHALIVAFVSTGTTLGMLQFPLSNPGCTKAIDHLGDTQVRCSTFLLAYSWLSSIIYIAI